MAKLYLLRHLKSQWNKDNRFAGWVDNPLSDEGQAQAAGIADQLRGQKIDVGYTSPLVRNMETIVRVFERLPDMYPLFIHLDGGRMQTWGNFTGISGQDVPVYVSETLNERYYGDLQGLNKAETAEKYGEELAHKWRRGYKDKPPGGESLEDMYNRAVPFFIKRIKKDLEAGKNVLLATSGNTLRAVIKYIENISDEGIADVELPFGALVQYEFDGKTFTKK